MTMVLYLFQSLLRMTATVMSDEYRPYRSLNKLGYDSQRVNHSANEYVKGNVTTNALEGTWAHLKHSIQAIYVGVSQKHLQKYCAEFSFRYNRREMSDGERFEDWFGYCRGHITYKKLIAGKRRPRKITKPKNPLSVNRIRRLPDIECIV